MSILPPGGQLQKLQPAPLLFFSFLVIFFFSVGTSFQRLVWHFYPQKTKCIMNSAKESINVNSTDITVNVKLFCRRQLKNRRL